MSNTGMGRPHNLSGAWLELVEAVGTVAMLAKSLHISTRTLNRYANGEYIPSIIVQESINAFARQNKCTEPYARTAHSR